MTKPAPLLANVLGLATLAGAAALHAWAPDLYYLSVQEDEALEWASFWAFLLAAAASAASALGRPKLSGRGRWFPLAVAGFCLFVAMEEVSWGQRLLGYRPPAYFLARNYQQELNLHNVVASRYRELALEAVIAGYGIALPLAALVPRLASPLTRLGVVAPPAGLVPCFFGALVAYLWYPWKYTGEWVEFLLGLGFLFAAVLRPGRSGDAGAAPGRLLPVAAGWLAVVGLGGATAATFRLERSARPEALETARVELEMLRRDFEGGAVPTNCGLHKRLYTYVEEYRRTDLREGRFARLTAEGLDGARAEFFLDPWNSPYWILHTCSADRTRRTSFVYSFGSNRRRDSTPWELRPDDVGAHVDRAGGPSAADVGPP